MNQKREKGEYKVVIHWVVTIKKTTEDANSSEFSRPYPVPSALKMLTFYAPLINT